MPQAGTGSRKEDLAGKSAVRSWGTQRGNGQDWSASLGMTGKEKQEKLGTPRIHRV